MQMLRGIINYEEKNAEKNFTVVPLCVVRVWKSAFRSVKMACVDAQKKRDRLRRLDQNKFP